MAYTKEEFIYNTLKKGTNSMKSTIFFVTGIGGIKTRKKVREALEMGISVKKKCKVIGDCYVVNYDTLKWDKVESVGNFKT